MLLANWKDLLVFLRDGKYHLLFKAPYPINTKPRTYHTLGLSCKIEFWISFLAHSKPNLFTFFSFLCFHLFVYIYIALTMNGNGDMRGASRTSLGSSRGHFASTESLQMAQHQPPNPSIVNSLPPTDENAEVVLNLNWILNTHCFKICV